MPTISFFYGIMIRMYLKDHAPPHFHAFYAGFEGVISIATGEVLDGFLPKNAAHMVQEWTLARRALLMDNWARAHAGTQLQRIAGLDAE